MKDVKDFDKSKCGLFPVRLDTVADLVFVNVDWTAPSLREYLGDLPEQFKEYGVLDQSGSGDWVSVSNERYSVAGNWKLCIENFLEYYHLPSVHPELCKVSVVDNHIRTQGDGSYVGFVTHPLGNGGTPIDANVLPAMPGLSNPNLQTAHYQVVFPNVFWFLYPHSMFTVTVLPDENDPMKAIEYANLSVHKSALEAPDAERKLKEMLEFYKMVNDEDIGIIERVQKGMKVHEYAGGRFSFRFEETIHRFQNMLADYMIGARRVPLGDKKLTPGASRKLGPQMRFSREPTF
jgi:choline monooxygenase